MFPSFSLLFFMATKNEFQSALTLPPLLITGLGLVQVADVEHYR